MRLKLTIVLSLIVLSGIAQDQSLNLDRIFKSSDFTSQRFGPARWVNGGKSYTTLEASPEYPSAADIVQYQAKSGKREILVSAERLIPANADQPLQIHDYQWSHDKEWLMIYTNSKRVWRRNTRGDYWILNLASGALRQLGEALPESSLMFAKFSPDDKMVAYVSKHNLYVEGVRRSEYDAAYQQWYGAFNQRHF